MKKLLQGLVVFVLVFGARSSFASNFSFLSNAPVRELTSEDWNIVQDLTDKVLDNYPDNKAAAWKNPHSGHHGTIIALNKYQKDGKVCRDITFTSYTSFGRSASRYPFCKYPSLGWKIPG